MFATQQYMDSMPDPARKRPREDSVDFGASASFSEHRNKRVQCLPLRSSPRVDQPSQDIQPSTEVDMMDDVNSSPIAHINHLRQYDVDSRGTGRMPTPIQPSFAAQVRGSNGVVNMGHHHAGLADPHSVPRSMAAEDWQDVQNNRRLPSPISEGSTSMPSANAGMMLDDIDEHGDQTAAGTDADASSPPRLPADAGAGESSPSPSRKGHCRNTHTVNTWTWQPGMKRSFSIGYRSDCEKCRLKVPGHFNHIIVS